MGRSVRTYHWLGVPRGRRAFARDPAAFKMGLRYKDQELGYIFFVTTSFTDHIPFGDIDGTYGALAEALLFRLNAVDMKLISYVFMHTHLHLMLIIDGKTLAGFMRDFKKFTAQKSLAGLCGTNRIWQEGYDRQAILTPDVMLTKINYIHQNPVRAGLAKKPEDYYWSSAADYLGIENGPLPVYQEWA